MTVFELFDMFPDEVSARRWFERVRWAATAGIVAPRTPARFPTRSHCPTGCTDCRKYFSVKVGTPMHRSKIPLRKWVVAIYMLTTSLKGVSSMKLYRELGVSQPTAWFMIHRIREAWNTEGGKPFRGPVEVDETNMGGKERVNRLGTGWSSLPSYTPHQ